MQATIFCNPIADDFTVVLFQWTDATGRLWQVTSDGISADSVSLKVNGSTLASEPHIAINEDMRIDALQSGGNINWSFRPMLAHATLSGSFAGTLGAVTSFTANPNNTVTTGSLSIGQVRVWDGTSEPDFKTSTQSVSAWNGYPGELATDRLTRLCTEQGVAFSLTGTSTMAMGTQAVDTFVSLLRECESADLGILFDGQGPGLSYVARTSLYNVSASLTLNASTGQVDDPFDPEDDDQRNRNLVKVTRKDGGSATAEDVTGPLGTNTIGTYDTAVTVNTKTDTPLANIAWWLLRLGTVDEPYRYPKLNLNLAAAAAVASNWLGTSPGERIDVTNVSSVSTQHPAGSISLLLEGYTERLAPHEWTVQANCSPYSPWNVDALNQTFRLEMAGQTLAANLVAGATSLSLATASGHQLFTTTAAFPADFPMDLNVAGWQIHVTAASGTSSPQTLTITAAPNTSTIPLTTAVTLWRPAVLAL